MASTRTCGCAGRRSDPDVALTPGYDPGLMPGNYGQLLKPEELDVLVAYMLTLE